MTEDTLAELKELYGPKAEEKEPLLLEEDGTAILTDEKLERNVPMDIVTHAPVLAFAKRPVERVSGTSFVEKAMANTEVDPEVLVKPARPVKLEALLAPTLPDEAAAARVSNFFEKRRKKKERSKEKKKTVKPAMSRLDMTRRRHHYADVFSNMKGGATRKSCTAWLAKNGPRSMRTLAQAALIKGADYPAPVWNLTGRYMKKNRTVLSSLKWYPEIIDDFPVPWDPEAMILWRSRVGYIIAREGGFDISSLDDYLAVSAVNTPSEFGFSRTKPVAQAGGLFSTVTEFPASLSHLATTLQESVAKLGMDFTVEGVKVVHSVDSGSIGTAFDTLVGKFKQLSSVVFDSLSSYGPYVAGILVGVTGYYVLRKMGLVQPLLINLALAALCGGLLPAVVKIIPTCVDYFFGKAEESTEDGKRISPLNVIENHFAYSGEDTGYDSEEKEDYPSPRIVAQGVEDIPIFPLSFALSFFLNGAFNPKTSKGWKQIVLSSLTSTRHVGSALESFLSFLAVGAATFSERIGMPGMAMKLHPYPEVLKIQNQMFAMITSMKANQNTTADLTMIMQWKLEVERLERRYKTNDLKTLAGDLHRLYKAVNNRLGGCVSKPTTVVLYVCGGSGSGKSEATKLIARLMALALCPEHALEEMSENIALGVYAVPTTKYATGFAGQSVALINDFGITKETPGEPGLATQIIMAAGDPIATELPMAAIEDKGKLAAFKLVVVSSNIEEINSTTVPNINCHAAFNRRLTFKVNLDVNPEFATEVNGVKVVDRAKALRARKADGMPTELNPDVWRFETRATINGREFEARLDLGELLDLIKDRLEQNHTDYVEGLKYRSVTADWARANHINTEIGKILAEPIDPKTGDPPVEKPVAQGLFEDRLHSLYGPKKKENPVPKGGSLLYDPKADGNVLEEPVDDGWTLYGSLRSRSQEIGLSGKVWLTRIYERVCNMVRIDFARLASLSAIAKIGGVLLVTVGSLVGYSAAKSGSKLERENRELKERLRELESRSGKTPSSPLSEYLRSESDPRAPPARRKENRRRYRGRVRVAPSAEGALVKEAIGFDYTDPAFIAAQSTVSDMQFMNSLAGNTYLVEVYNSRGVLLGTKGKAFSPRTGMMIFPIHYILDRDTTDRVKFTRITAESISVTVSIEDLLELQEPYSKDGNSDLVCCLGDIFPAVRNFVDRTLSAADLIACRGQSREVWNFDPHPLMPIKNSAIFLKSMMRLPTTPIAYESHSTTGETDNVTEFVLEAGQYGFYRSISYSGACGNYIFLMRGGVPVLAGIHVAGDSAASGYCQLITSDRLHELASKVYTGAPLSEGNPVLPSDVDLKGDPSKDRYNLTHVGTSRFPSQAGRTSKVPAPLHGQFDELIQSLGYDTAMRPAFLGFTEEGVHVLDKRLAKYGSDRVALPAATVNSHVRYRHSELLASGLSLKGRGLVSVMGAITGVEKGVKISEGIPAKTSMGYPTAFTLMDAGIVPSPNKRHLFGEGYEMMPAFSEFMRRCYNPMLEAVLDGKYPLTYFTPSAKDEVLPLEKVRNKDTRCILIADLPFQILTRQAYGWALDALTDPAIAPQSGHAVGVDPMKFWTTLARYLDGDNYRGKLFMDVKGCDRSLGPQYIGAMFDLLDRIDPCADGSDLAKIRAYVRYVVMHPIINLRGNLYAGNGGNMSGTIFTVVINGEAGILMLRLARAMVEDPDFDPLTQVFEDWDDVGMRIVTHGDDSAVGLSGNLSITTKDIAAAAKILGFNLTNADKTDPFKNPMPVRIPLEECAFLKRTFKPSNGIVLAPLDMSSIAKSLNWCGKKRLGYWETVKQNQFECLEHGQEGKELALAIADAMVEAGNHPVFPCTLAPALTTSREFDEELRKRHA